MCQNTNTGKLFTGGYRRTGTRTYQWTKFCMDFKDSHRLKSLTYHDMLALPTVVVCQCTEVFVYDTFYSNENKTFLMEGALTNELAFPEKFQMSPENVAFIVWNQTNKILK